MQQGRRGVRRPCTLYGGSERQRLVGKAPRLGDGTIDHLALHDVQTQGQFVVLPRGALPALVGQLDDIGQRSVCQREGRGARNGAGIFATQ